MEPYRGLQPYTEEYEEYFFGRDAERAILIDKILSDKLTLLFSATGVGKSSLLQAAVMPELKRPARENLDVVYYNDWVTPPLTGLKQKILAVLQERGKIATNFQFLSWEGPGADHSPLEEPVLSEVEGGQGGVSPSSFPSREGPGVGDSPLDGGQGGVLSLKQFLHICATFASEPLVIILDQFEEFFQYQRYTEHFIPFIAQLAEAIRGRETSVAFLISMREDFALNLNAFKEYLPTTLFENYYRLEKLEIKEAEEAIEKPVEKAGFRYEKGLLQTLLKDLADQERESRIGSQKALIPETAPAFVEPPNVQIVCTQLWDMEKGNPDKVIRTEIYKKKGGSKGFITTYFERVITTFSPSEKKLASKAFDHLVTPRGTKMAYPVKDLSDKLRVEEEALGNVLAKLEKARVLRSQKRKEELWYELYHDTFSGIIYQWNSDYKARQRIKQGLFGLAIGCGIFVFVFLAVNAFLNFTNHHFRLSTKGISNQIELWRGEAKGQDIFYLQHYEAETSYQRSQIEPDKQFLRKPIAAHKNLNLELIGNMSILGRIRTYWEAGEVKKALELADKSVSEDDMSRTSQVINSLAGFRSQQAFEVLKNHLFSEENDSTYSSSILSFFTSIAYAAIGTEVVPGLPYPVYSSQNIQQSIISVIQFAQFKGIRECLGKLLQNKNPDVRSSAAKALGYQGNLQTIEQLNTLLEDPESTVRLSALTALTRLSGDKTVLDELQKDESLIPMLMERLQEKMGSNVPSYGYDDELEIVLALLIRIVPETTLEYLTGLIQNQNTTPNYNVIGVLNQLSRDELIFIMLARYKEVLLPFLREQIRDRIRAIGPDSGDQSDSGLGTDLKLLVKLDTIETINVLIELIQSQNMLICHNAIRTLNYVIHNHESILTILQQNHNMKRELVESLQNQIRKESDFYQNEMTNAAMRLLLWLDKKEVIAQLAQMLESQNSDVRHNALLLTVTFRQDESFLKLLQHSNNVDIFIKHLKEYAKERMEEDSKTSYLSYSTYSIGINVDEILKLLLSLEQNQTIAWLSTLLTDRNPFVRYKAAETLLHTEAIDESRAQATLLELLNDLNPLVRYKAVATLIQDEHVEQSKAQSILVELLREPIKPQIQINAAWLLGRLKLDDNDETVGMLVEQLTHKDPNLRASASDALVKLNSPKSVEPLVKLLQDRDPTLRSTVVRLLGQLDCVDTTEYLLALLDDQEPSVRIAIVHALGMLDSNNIIAPLEKLLQDQDKRVQQVAESKLYWLGSGKSPDPLMRVVPFAYTQNEPVNELKTILSYQNRFEGYFDIYGQWYEASSRRGYYDANGVWRSSQSSLEIALHQLNDNVAVTLLIKLLDAQDENLQYAAALALGKLSVVQAIPSLKSLYGKEQHAVRIITNYTPIVSFVYLVSSWDITPRDATQVSLAAAAALLSLGEEDGVEFLKQQAKSEDSYRRNNVAEILGATPSSIGNSILLSMLDDEEFYVETQVINSLGKAQAKEALPKLHNLLQDPEQMIRQDVVYALGELSAPESIELLRQRVLDAQERVSIRIAAIDALGNISTEEAVATLLEVLDMTIEHYHYRTILALGRIRSKQALSKLLTMLREQEHRKTKWRKIRDEKIDGYTDEQIEEWRKRLEEVEPQTYIEFELAHAIAQIDSDGEGAKLLSHDLANVREGAWTGLARLPLTETRPFYLTDGPAAIKLIERLDRERMQSKHPLFRHAAYRAIDGMLISIEAYGSKPDLEALEAFLPKVQDQEGVLTRVEWTIARLREREERD